jgi:hypothetical protein
MKGNVDFLRIFVQIFEFFVVSMDTLNFYL